MSDAPLDVRSLCLIRETLARHDGLADFAFAMQGLGKPGVNMANMQWGTPHDFQFYFPGYADGGMSGDLENTGMPVELYQRMPQLASMNSTFRAARSRQACVGRSMFGSHERE